MKAYKIDVTKREVEEIEVKNLMDIYRSIGNQCEHHVCPIKLKNGDLFFVDDEALLKRNLDGCFMVKGVENVLVGNAVVIGSNSTQELADVTTKKEILETKMMWGDIETAHKYRMMMESNIRAIYYN